MANAIRKQQHVDAYQNSMASSHRSIEGAQRPASGHVHVMAIWAMGPHGARAYSNITPLLFLMPVYDSIFNLRHRGFN